MDKKGRIQEHSKIKLELYRAYVELYLTVLLNSRSFKEVHVHDIFAGKGKTEDGAKGSALLAAIEIQKVRARFSGTPVTLWLNEKRKTFFDSLQEILKPFNSFVSMSNEDANLYITKWKPTTGVHNLFFIDPHGYTQLSTDNLKRLFSMQACDFLIFMPTYHIYRFLKPSAAQGTDNEEDDFFSELGIDIKSTPVVDKEKFYKPITDFLSGLGIEKSDAEKCGSVEEFSDLIAGALSSISHSEYVYSQMIKKQGFNSKYTLFFISHHILGAEKFLDAQHELKEKIKQPEQQQAFDFISPPEKNSILSFANKGQMYDNVSLYQLAIKSGLRAPEVKAELKKLEKDSPNKIKIEPLPSKERKRGGLYVDYQHYKAGNRIISIVFKE